MVANDSSVIYDDYSCLQKVTCPQATTYGLRGNFHLTSTLETCDISDYRPPDRPHKAR